MTEFLTLDGSSGEGGGQILRTALALAVALGRPVKLARIRARRPKPGLQPQHLTVVRALAALSDATVVGDTLNSTELTFVPQALRGGAYRFDVGAVKESAGSVSLLFQALLLPLALAQAPSRLTLLGGTHVPWSPPVHYLTDVFLPALAEIGVEAHLVLRRWGWYPAGGGVVEATIQPTRGLRGVVFGRPEAPVEISGLSAVSRLPRSIAERQRRRALERLAATGLNASIALEEDTSARGPGTVLFLTSRGRAGFSALGRRGVPAERVADEAVDQLLAYIATGAPVDDHLADQLVAFLALARGESAFSCPTLPPHLRTVVEVVGRLLQVRIRLEEGPPARVWISPEVQTDAAPRA
ncbi:MAG: RNA 3'-phosphate cyclase [Candidatus Rokubacteria bacterium]|nr:RNA 3'-phosphate cyclase [Candidatus Rokubacteria bacterium]